MIDRELRKNAEGYSDPTAYHAIKNLESEDHEKVFRLLGCIFRICELAGFTIENRIILRDNKTGKVWK